jgi:tetratricopeptide (TPR) repeat protein
MKLLKALNKEQWAAAAVLALGVLFVGGSLAGGSGGSAQKPPSAGDLPYERTPQRFPEFVDEKFERYSPGAVFKPKGADKLPIPPLRAPEPREEEFPAPLLRPGPATEAYNRLSLKSKYPCLSAQAPPVAAADLPAQADLDALKKLEEPPPMGRVDRRAEKEREWFTVFPKSGAPRMGTLLLETVTHLRFKNKDGNNVESWEKDKLVRWEYNRTHFEKYLLETARIQAGPREAAERTALARGLIEKGMLKEAREELQRAIEAKRDHVEAVLLLGQILAEAGDFEGAVGTLDAGIGAGAPAADLRYEIGKCLRALGFQEGAASAFAKALEASPRHAAAKLALARAQLDLDMPVEAAATANDFFVKMGNAPDVTPAQKAEATTLRGMAALRSAREEKALERAKADFQEAIRLDPQSAESMNGLGAVLALEGQNAEAAKNFAAAARASQYLIEGWTNLATLLLLSGKWADAEAIALAAQQRDPTSAEAVLVQGLAQAHSGNKAGTATLERAVQMDPRHAQARTALGLVRLRENLDDEALSHFVAALRSDFTYLPAYSGAAAAYLRTGRRFAGEAAAQRDDARAEELRRKAQERRVSAETLLRTVRDYDPNRASAHIALGCAYAVMGRPQEALQAMGLARSLLAARPEPIIFYVQGYVEYYHAPLESEEARLDSAYREFEQGVKLKGQSPDPYSVRVVADCEQAKADIEDWKVTSLRLNETFERESGKSAGSNWIESDGKYGVEVTLENTKERGGRAKFSGRQLKGWGITTLSRAVPGQNFHALEATFYPEKMDRAEHGLSIYHTQQGNSWVGFHVGFDSGGKVRFNPSASEGRDMDGRDMAVGWTEVKTPLPNPKEVTVRITRGERNRAANFTIWFWDPAKGEWILAQKEVTVSLAAARGQNWQISFFGRAWDAQEYTFYVDNIRVYERERR